MFAIGIFLYCGENKVVVDVCCISIDIFIYFVRRFGTWQTTLIHYLTDKLPLNVFRFSKPFSIINHLINNYD